MDLFAIVLITITILTICGICLFIFICALQPKILRYFHRKKHRTYYITASKNINNDLNINNCNSITETSLTSIDSDKRAYLKVIERSVRTGKRMEDEKESNPYDSLRQYTYQ